MWSIGPTQFMHTWIAIFCKVYGRVVVVVVMAHIHRRRHRRVICWHENRSIEQFNATSSEMISDSIYYMVRQQQHVLNIKTHFVQTGGVEKVLYLHKVFLRQCWSHWMTLRWDDDGLQKLETNQTFGISVKKYQ